MVNLMPGRNESYRMVHRICRVIRMTALVLPSFLSFSFIAFWTWMEIGQGKCYILFVDDEIDFYSSEEIPPRFNEFDVSIGEWGWEMQLHTYFTSSWVREGESGTSAIPARFRGNFSLPSNKIHERSSASFPWDILWIAKWSARYGVQPPYETEQIRIIFSISGSPWVIVLFLSAWPLIAFLRGPIRRWRRRRRNLCIHCGYNLTGNTTDVCSECGHKRVTVNSTKLRDKSDGTIGNGA